MFLLARFRTFVYVVCSLFVCLFAASGTRAQPLGDLVVVPFGTPDTGPAIQVTAMLEAELFNARFSIISLHDARDRFAAHSRPPQTPTDSDLDVLAREARGAVEHVAFGRTAAAQKSVREVITRAERTLESLNRETTTARQILDACLSLVRSTLQTGHRDHALEQATRCRRLVPDLAPAEAAHPANVIGVLAEADNLLRRMRLGKLTVRSSPHSDCAVYLNGRHLGTTPFRIDRAAAGEYRVQVECGRTVGRVHTVQLGDQPIELLVDTDFDRAVASEPRVLLRYPDARTARAQVVAHAVQLGRGVEVDDVVLVDADAERAEFVRVNVPQQRVVGRARVPFSERHGFEQPALARAIELLAAGRDEAEPPEALVDEPSPAHAAPPPQASVATPPPPAAISAVEPPTGPRAKATASSQPMPAPLASALPRPRRQPARERRMRRAGLGLIGPAVALYGIGVAAELRSQRLVDNALAVAYRVSPVTPIEAESLRALHDHQNKYERMRKLRWIGLPGVAAATASAALLVTPRPRLPWWSYALGAAAVGLVGAGAYEIAAADRCELRAQDACRRRRESLGRGVLIASAAAPLLTVPTAQLLKGRFRKASVLAVSSGAYAELQLTLHVTF